MIPILAQADLGQMPAPTLKWIIIFGVGSIVTASFAAAGLFAGLSYLLELRRERREELRAVNPAPTQIAPVPLPVHKISPSATMRDLNEKHDEHGRRLDGHDREITSLWNTMRMEDKEIRKDMADKFDSISRALGRIEGALPGKE